MRDLRRLGWFLSLFVAVGTLVLLAVASGRRSDALWTDFRGADRVVPSDSGFVVVDGGSSSRPVSESEGGRSVRRRDPLGDQAPALGPLASVPSFLGDEVVLQEDRPGLATDAASGDIGQVRWREVEVGTGDTLGGIAAEAKISQRSIARANELKDADRLREGQVLFVPLSDSPSDVLVTLARVRKVRAEAVARQKEARPISVTYYVAKAGDSLWSIANKFDLDVNTLIGCNRMGDMNVLKPGITLRIPNQDGIFVTVKAGDTLKGLADRLEVFPEAVASANGLSLDGALTAGKSLFVPGAKPVAYFEAETKAGRTGGAVERISGRSGFGWPVVGRINSPFGWRGDPFSGRRDFHTGVDIKGPTGRGIAAAASGRVVYAGWMSGYGKTVVIEHPGGYTTLYGHCSSLLCREGSRVSRGDLIARVGSTGRSTGSHLHFEVRVGGTPVNPLRYLR